MACLASSTATSPVGAPLITDATASASGAHFAPVMQVIYDTKVRYIVQIDSTYPTQSVLRVEAFNADTVSWSELWTLEPSACQLASAYGQDLGGRVRSWQRVYDDLRTAAVAVLI